MHDPDFDRLPGHVAKATRKWWVPTIVEIAVLVCIVFVLVVLLMPAVRTNHGSRIQKSLISARVNTSGKAAPR